MIPPTMGSAIRASSAPYIGRPRGGGGVMIARCVLEMNCEELLDVRARSGF